MSRRNNPGWLLATSLALAAPAGGGAQPGAGLPDPGDVSTAYLTARDWLQSFSLPLPESPRAAVPIDGAAGACVIIRANGRLVGMGTDATADALMLRRAAGNAFSAALGHPFLADLPDVLRDQAGRQMTLSLEIAGTLEPLVLRSLDAIDDHCEPGIHGLAMRRGAHLSMLFPSQLMARGRAGQLALEAAALAPEMQCSLMELRRALEIGEVSLYRFQSIHIAQDRPGGPPTPLVRGQTIVSPAAADVDATRGIADVIAGRIVGVLPYMPPPDHPEGPRGLMGDYDLALDSCEPLIASGLEQALLAFALARYAAAPGVDRTLAARAQALGAQTLRDLAAAEAAAPEEAGDPRTAAAIIYGADVSTIAQVTTAADRVAATFDPRTGFLQSSNLTLDGHAQALLAGAAARAAARGYGTITPQRAREMVEAAWGSVPEVQQVTLLPWIAWAEDDLASTPAAGGAAQARLAALWQQVDRSRIGGSSAAPDLIGAFALAAGPSPRANASRATAQSLRPAVFMATELRRNGADPVARSPGAVANHLLSVRYLMQLTVRPDDGIAVRNPDAALGGVRSSTWDTRVPAAAQAMGLLLAAETLVSLDRAGPASPGPSR